MISGIIFDETVYTLPGTKPTVHVTDSFRPEGIDLCKENFNAILPGQIKRAKWKENVKFLLISPSRLIAKDIAPCLHINNIEGRLCADGITWVELCMPCHMRSAARLIMSWRQKNKGLS